MKSICRRLIPIIILCMLATLPAPAVGFMQIRNFTRNAYAGGPQNWAVTQDSIGRMYVGNRDGMLSFDGERWQKHTIPNSTTVRSLLYDPHSERIYCGATEEFGYFEPAPAGGQLKYVSLLPTLADKQGFTEVWNVLKTANAIWFQCDNLLLRYDGHQTSAIPSPRRISCSEGIGGTVYIGTEDGVIARADTGGLSIMHRNPALAGSKIRAILPFNDKLLIATEVNGLYACDDTRIEPLQCDINGFLADNQLFCGATDGLGNYVFGTVTHGAVVKNFSTGATRYVNKECGMQNNTVLKAAFDKAGNIWLCLDNGLDYAIYNSPIANIIGTSNDAGAGYASFLCGETMYFGTNQGLFSTPYPFQSSPSPISLTRRLQGQIWSITEIDANSFFIAGDAGAYVRTSAGIKKINGLTGTYCIRVLRNPAAAVASCYDGFHLLTRHDDGTWSDSGLLGNCPQVSGEFEIDGQNSLWISHWLKGVYHLQLNLPQKRFDDITFFTDKHGLPSSRNNSVAIYRGRIVVVNTDGFYTLDHDGNSFVTDDELTALFKKASPLSLHCGTGAMALIERKGIRVVRSGFAESAVSELTMAKSLNEGLVNGFEHVNILSPNEIIVSNQNGFWSIDPEKNGTASDWQPRPLISTVYANGDSLVYRRSGTAGANVKLTLPYNLNSLRFDFTCPDYRSEGSIRYSSCLDGYDDDWSQPSTESSREYTKLPEGRYTLHLRAVNMHNNLESQTQLEFTIAPPWYRSTTAKICYICAIMMLGAMSIIGIKRWKSNAERRLESLKEEELAAMRHTAEQEALQKDYEIATLKSEQLEIDIKHKSDELSSATMNVIRKNEILNDIASKISKIQSDKSLDAGVQKQLVQIQTAIGQNISHDDDWNTFNRNFDVVYGDYTKRLLEQHPHLSKADIRLCCYIKMGLTSKEIAPLVNISFKSVEMARYRLRKKMDLPAETSLTDYISSL